MLIPLPDWPGAQHPGNQAHQNREPTTGADSGPSYRSTAQHTRHLIEFRPGWESSVLFMKDCYRVLRSSKLAKGQEQLAIRDLEGSPRLVLVAAAVVFGNQSS